MEMTVIDKLLLIVKYITSSFMGIELYLLSLLLFLFTILNIKKNNKVVKIVSIILCVGFLIGLMIAIFSIYDSVLFYHIFYNYSIYFYNTI